MKRVGVVGAGVMGHGIAELCAIAGFDVLLSDISDEVLSNARQKIKWSLESLSKKKVLREATSDIFSRIRTTTALGDLKSVEYVIEAVKEDSSVKKVVLEKLSEVIAEDCIISSNTSTIPISELASVTARDEKFVGLHFSNPPVMMPLIEIIRGDKTDDATVRRTEDFVRTLGRDYVIVKKDVPGFVINRLNDRVITESMTLLEEGVNKEDLDAMVRFRLDFPMGMCELLDFVGIDTAYLANKELISRGFNTRSSSILREKVESGKIGMKSGEGFYKYSGPNVYERPQLIPTEGMYKVNPVRLIGLAINEAAWIVRNGVASMEDVEKAMTKAMNWPDGPLTMADKFGLDDVVDVLNRRHSARDESRYDPDPLLLEMLDRKKLGRKTGEGFRKWKFEETTFGPVNYRKMENFALLMLNRPDKLNALNEATWKGLLDGLEHAIKDDDVRSVFITGNGRAFSAGDDIEMMKSWKGQEDADAWMEKYAHPLISKIMNYPKPVVSLVNGLAYGGGCELNMLLDVVVASEDAVFSLPEGLIGAMPPIASSYGVGAINRKLGRFALTGESFSAPEAVKLGIVDIVVPKEQLAVMMSELSDRFSKIAPLSSRKIKETLNEVKNNFSQNVSSGEKALTALVSSNDFKEGQKAFLEKRKPKWTGK